MSFWCFWTWIKNITWERRAGSRGKRGRSMKSSVNSLADSPHRPLLDYGLNLDWFQQRICKVLLDLLEVRLWLLFKGRGPLGILFPVQLDFGLDSDLESFWALLVASMRTVAENVERLYLMASLRMRNLTMTFWCGSCTASRYAQGCTRPCS